MARYWKLLKAPTFTQKVNTVTACEQYVEQYV